MDEGGTVFDMARAKARVLFWISTVLAGLSVILVISNGLLFLVNQEAQAAVNRRQQFINQSAQFGRLNEALVRALATTAANKKATQTRPPTMCRDSSARGSKENTKITTTSREKNSMALSASLERHSRRMSLVSVASVIDQNDLTIPPLAKGWVCGR